MGTMKRETSGGRTIIPKESTGEPCIHWPICDGAWVWSDKSGVWDVWRCADCGVGYLFRRRAGKHGGPIERALDRRYGLLGRCWGNLKCKSHARVHGQIVLLSVAAPNPPEQVQDDPVLMDVLQSGEAAKKAASTRSERWINAG